MPFAICGNTVVGFSSDPKIDAAFMEQEAQKILRGNGFKANVKIFTRLPQVSGTSGFHERAQRIPGRRN